MQQICKDSRISPPLPPAYTDYWCWVIAFMCWEICCKNCNVPRLWSHQPRPGRGQFDKLLARIILTIHHEADCEYITANTGRWWGFTINTSSPQPQPLIVHKHSIRAQEAISEAMSYLAIFSMFESCFIMWNHLTRSALPLLKKDVF